MVHSFCSHWKRLWQYCNVAEGYLFLWRWTTSYICTLYLYTVKQKLWVYADGNWDTTTTNSKLLLTESRKSAFYV